jgi:putative ATP-dependent endonuclease of OLD family
VRINNFANFANLDIATGESIVVVGENKVGKSNFILALRLLLDPSLSERDRYLGIEQFWDGLGDSKLGATVEISIELQDFEDNPRLLAHLNDCLVDIGPPMVARLTYQFRPKSDLAGPPESLADYEYIMFGGDDPDLGVGPGLRRMLPLDVLEALRDAERDLGNWRRSPLRPLIEELTSQLGDDERAAIQTEINAALDQLAAREEVSEVAGRISQRLVEIVGAQHATEVSLGVAPTRVDALLRGLRLLIDDGARSVGEASLGTANLIFLALKSLELDRLVEERERDHTFFAVEEPEAHLHPHVQRLVYRYFLEQPVGGEDAIPLTTILTTHSPHIASVSPIRSIVLLRQDRTTASTIGVSTARAPLTARDEADLARYIDVTRGEVFFARGIILAEGDAERFLIPAFATELGIPLDVLGISVCSVAGTNFSPYVKLLGSDGLSIPYVLLTDLDPSTPPNPPLAAGRIRALLALVQPGVATPGDLSALWTRAAQYGWFVNSSTLEVELFCSGLAPAIQHVLREELSLNQQSATRLQGWVNNPATLDRDAYLRGIERVGKGRFAQRLAPNARADACPDYMRRALERIRDAVA